MSVATTQKMPVRGNGTCCVIPQKLPSFETVHRVNCIHSVMNMFAYYISKGLNYFKRL